MKFETSQANETITMFCNHIVADEVIEVFARFMVAAGWQKESVIRAMEQYAFEYREAEKGDKDE